MGSETERRDRGLVNMVAHMLQYMAEGNRAKALEYFNLLWERLKGR